MPEEAKKIFREKLDKRFKWVDEQLAGRDYLMGNHFTVPDAYLFAVTRWSKPTNIDLAPYPHLAAHHARMAERPAVQEALKVEGLQGK
jgi:glutathione S-transferase